MVDLRYIMYEAVSDITDPEASVVRTDLVLGRQALARHRFRRVGRQALIPAGIAAAAAGVFGISVLANNPGSGTTARNGTSEVGRSGSSRIALIAYTGKQPEGFTINQVPEGWEIQKNAGYVVIAPMGFANQDVQEVSGKIDIAVATKDELAVDRLETRALRVGNVTATRFSFPDRNMVVNTYDEPKAGPESNAGLLLPAGKQTNLIQFTKARDWDDATIARFAAGGAPDRSRPKSSLKAFPGGQLCRCEWEVVGRGWSWSCALGGCLPAVAGE